MEQKTPVGDGSDSSVQVQFEPIEPHWNPESIDMAAYFERIEYSDARTPTIETLTAIHRAHSQSIPFENLDIPIGRGIKVGLPDIEGKLIHQRRGGYCFEQNPLLAAVLTRLGFKVRRGSARGPMGPEQESPVAYDCGHAMMVVETQGTSFLCDVGVGYLGSSAPVPLVDGGEFVDGGWRYRTDRVSAGPDFAGWMLRIHLSGAWSNVYAFSNHAFFHADYVNQNFIATDHPNSPFRKQLIIQRTGPGERLSLRNTQLTTRMPHAPPRVETISLRDFERVVQERFSLDVDGELLRWIAQMDSTSPGGRATSH